jgi:hypothetical protein
MNSRQKKVLLIGGALVTLMLLFPPWDYFDPDTSGRRPAGYHFFLTPPEPRPAKEIFLQARFPHMLHVRLNDFRLVIQLSITIPIFLGLTAFSKTKRSKISIGAAIIFFSIALVEICFVTWLVVSNGLEYGRWELP